MRRRGTQAGAHAWRERERGRPCAQCVHAHSTRSSRALCATTSMASEVHGAVAKETVERCMSSRIASRSAAGTSAIEARTRRS